jgi:hypothetical protein
MFINTVWTGTSMAPTDDTVILLKASIGFWRCGTFAHKTTTPKEYTSALLDGPVTQLDKTRILGAWYATAPQKTMQLVLLLTGYTGVRLV